MSKDKIVVGGIEIGTPSHNQERFINLTNIAAGFDNGSSLIENWLRSTNTLQYLAAWERMNNQNFNSIEFEGIKAISGENKFSISVKQWVSRTNAIGIYANAGRYGGTCAHPDIAFHFAMWISPEFNLLIVKEFQRLKEEESKGLNQVWDMRRLIAKASYKIQTDAIKIHLIPSRNMPKDKEGIVYAEEAEILNFALFGTTAKDWKAKNPQDALQGLNIRDFADTHQLIVLSNLESLNASMIKQGISPKERFGFLRDSAIDQLKSLGGNTSLDTIKLNSPHKQIAEKKNDGSFNNTLKAIMKVPNPNKDKSNDKKD